MIKKVSSDEEIKTVAFLADKIWHEHYAGILPGRQIDYMVGKFQSFAAIKDSVVSGGYEYYLVSDRGVPVGYFGVCDTADRRLFLSKLYLDACSRGKGLGRKCIEFCVSIAKKRGHCGIRLTVNKNNPSKNIYEKLGFTVADSAVTDIGNNFVTDDFVMELSFNSKTL